MIAKRYKLGSQVDVIDPTLFEWNLCTTSKDGILYESFYIGTRNPSDAVVRKARELVDLLNKETET